MPERKKKIKESTLIDRSLDKSNSQVMPVNREEKGISHEKDRSLTTKKSVWHRSSGIGHNIQSGVFRATKMFSHKILGVAIPPPSYFFFMASSQLIKKEDISCVFNLFTLRPKQHGGRKSKCPSVLTGFLFILVSPLFLFLPLPFLFYRILPNDDG